MAIDESKFKAVNNRDKNFTKGKIASLLAHLEADVDRYITEMVRFDRHGLSIFALTSNDTLSFGYLVAPVPPVRAFGDAAGSAWRLGAFAPPSNPRLTESAGVTVSRGNRH